MALDTLILKTADQTRAQFLELAKTELTAKLSPSKADKELLESYVGTYENSCIFLDGEFLYYKGRNQVKLIPLTESFFAMENEESVRIHFQRTMDSLEIQFFYKTEKEIITRKRT